MSQLKMVMMLSTVVLFPSTSGGGTRLATPLTALTGARATLETLTQPSCVLKHRDKPIRKHAMTEHPQLFSPKMGGGVYLCHCLFRFPWARRSYIVCLHYCQVYLSIAKALSQIPTSALLFSGPAASSRLRLFEVIPPPKPQIMPGMLAFWAPSGPQPRRLTWGRARARARARGPQKSSPKRAARKPGRKRKCNKTP